MNDLNGIDRRQFAKGLIVATTSIAIASKSSIGQADDKPAAEEDKDQQSKPENSDVREELPPQEIVLLNLLMQRYPSENYDRPTLRGIFSDLRGDIARGEILSQFPLTNSDEPGYVFRAYRRDN